MNGAYDFEGRVELCYGNIWGTICGNYRYYWSTNDANVICNQLGHQPMGMNFYIRVATTYNQCLFGIKGAALAYFGRSIGPTFFQYLNCIGFESSLLECSRSMHQNIHRCHEIGVKCEGINNDSY